MKKKEGRLLNLMRVPGYSETVLHWHLLCCLNEWVKMQTRVSVDYALMKDTVGLTCSHTFNTDAFQKKISNLSKFWLVANNSQYLLYRNEVARSFLTTGFIQYCIFITQTRISSVSNKIIFYCWKLLNLRTLFWILVEISELLRIPNMSGWICVENECVENDSQDI